VIFATVAGHLAATGEVEEVIGAVPALDDVEPFVDLAPQRQVVQIACEEDRLDRAAQLRQRLVGRMLDILAGEAPQDGLGLGRAELSTT
jgi:hypothetical protein